MAQIDIRNAIVRIKDGYAGPGGTVTINAPAYGVGTATLALDGFAGALANGDVLVISGDNTNYVVTAHSETLGNTTSATVSPTLTQAVDDNTAVLAYQPNADPGAVDNGAGYSIGASVILTKDFVGIVATADRVKFAGHATIYRVTAHSETLGNTTSITVTPTLTSAVVDSEVIEHYEANADNLLINNTGVHNIGATTINVTGFSGALADFDNFTIAGDSTIYNVSSHSETLGNTTSITFTPALVASATTGEAVTVQPHSIEITFGDGNCTYDEKRTFKYIRDRGRLDTVRQEQDEPLEVSIDATWEFIRADSGVPPTIEDCLKNRGQASAWVSSSDDLCEPYAVDIEIEYDPPCSGEDREIITLEDFRWESFNHDLKAGTLAVKGKCNVTDATVLRAA